MHCLVQLLEKRRLDAFQRTERFMGHFLFPVSVYED